MEEALALFSTHLGVGIAENEADGREEIGLARAIATDDDVCLGREWLNDSLLLVAAAGWSVTSFDLGNTLREHRVPHLLKP